MNTANADVVVGLPVHNGEKYLSKALESLTAQKYPFLTIFVSDNASTDRTEQIVRSYRASDSRIIYHRMPTNVGALENFRFVLRETHSEFFMWAAHDDIWPENFVSSAVECMMDDPDAVMVNSATQLIDANDNYLPAWPTRPQLIDLAGLTYPQRIKEIATRVGWCIYGLIRRQAINKTSIYSDNSIAQDILLTYELAEHGCFRVLADTKPFKYRILPKSPELVARNLGAYSRSSTRPLTEAFGKILCAIELSGRPLSERNKARRVFIDRCARHLEWWNAIKNENNWPDLLSPCWVKRVKLSRLSRTLHT